MPNITDLPPAPDAPAPVVFFKRTAKGKSSFRKRAPTPPPPRASTATRNNSDSDTDDDTDDTSSDEPKATRPVKKRKRNVGGVATASISAARPDGPDQQQKQQQPDVGAAIYASTSRDIVSSTANEATKQSNWYDEDAEAALLGRRRQRRSSIDGGEGEGNEGGVADGAASSTYKGAAGYGSFIRKSESSASPLSR